MTAPANMGQFQLPGSPAPQAPAPQAPQAQPPQPQAPPALPPVNMNQRIPQGDQNWPQELWGKPIGEALRLYTIMRDDFIRRKREEQDAQRTQLQGQPQAPQGPAPTWPPQPQAPGQPQQPGWRQPQPGYQQPQAPQAPDAQTIEQAVSAALAKILPGALRPMHQASADQAFRSVRQEFPDWGNYHAGIIDALTGATEEQLANPELWRSVYYAVKGRALSQPNGNGQPQFAQQPQGQDQGNGVRNPNGAIITPAPNWEFSEPSGPGGPPQLPSYTAEDVLYARRFGMSLQEYLAYKGGQIPAPVPTSPPQAPAQQPRFGS